MQINNVASQIKDLIQTSTRILLITRENPTLDGVYSLLALDKYLKDLGKQTLLVAGKIETENIPGVENILSSLPPRNLVISFDYAEGSIEKVSYNVEGNRFNLVITPRSNSINPEQINYSYSGEEFDLIISVDVPDVSLMARGGSNISTNFANTPLVNLDHTQTNTLYGHINFVDPNVSSTSEIVVRLLGQLQALGSTQSELLYQGIKAATHDFTLGVKASTFEGAALCLRTLEETTSHLIPPNITIQENPEIKEKPSEAPASEEEATPDSSWLVPKIFRSSRSPN